MKRKCPKCGKQSLRIDNVMGTTQEIHWRCGLCCYKEKTGYDYETSKPNVQQVLGI